MLLALGLHATHFVRLMIGRPMQSLVNRVKPVNVLALITAFELALDNSLLGSIFVCKSCFPARTVLPHMLFPFLRVGIPWYFTIPIPVQSTQIVTPALLKKLKYYILVHSFKNWCNLRLRRRDNDTTYAKTELTATTSPTHNQSQISQPQNHITKIVE